MQPTLEALCDGDQMVFLIYVDTPARRPCGEVEIVKALVGLRRVARVQRVVANARNVNRVLAGQETSAPSFPIPRALLGIQVLIGADSQRQSLACVCAVDRGACERGGGVARRTGARIDAVARATRNQQRNSSRLTAIVSCLLP